MTFEQLMKQATELTEKELSALEKEIADTYRDGLKRIDGKIEAFYAKTLSGIPPEDYYNEASKYNRLVNLRKQVEEDYLAIAKSANGIIADEATLAISNSYYRGLYGINHVQSVFAVLAPEVIEASVKNTEGVWLKIAEKWGDGKKYVPESGSLLSELTNKRRAATVQQIKSTISASLLDGQAYRTTAKRIQGVMENDLNQALRIARTEGTRNLNAGQFALQNIAESEGIEGARVWNATLDARTRESHGRLDGKEATDGVWCIGSDCAPFPGQFSNVKNNVNCRCSTYIMVDGLPPTVRRARDPVSGENDIIDWTSFDEWAKVNGLRYNKRGILVKS